MAQIRGWLFLPLLALTAEAATYVVDTTNDVVATDGLTSLREAVLAANTNAGPDLIQLPAGRYVLTLAGTGEDAALTGDLDVNDHLTIAGAGAVVTLIDGNDSDRVMFVNSGAAVDLADVSIIRGYAAVGAGIYNQGDLRLSRCMVALNDAIVYGGGIHQFSGALLLRDSTVFDNTCGDTGGGGIDVGSGEVALTNCTVSGNASRAGGGIYREGGSVRLDHCTVTENWAATLGGGVYDLTASSRSILAGNTAAVAPDAGGGGLSLGYNLLGEGNSMTPIATDIVTNRAGLATLDVVQSATLVHALSNDSPAINRADPALSTNVLANDQRGPGFPRVRGLRADIGAVEHQNPDDDRDGMPDEWEWAHGFDPTNASDAALDADFDSFLNIEEYIADTQPTNGLSQHRIEACFQTGAIWTVVVPSSTACLYRLIGEPALSGGAWTNDISQGVGGGGPLALSATNPPAALGVRVERRAR